MRWREFAGQSQTRVYCSGLLCSVYNNVFLLKIKLTTKSLTSLAVHTIRHFLSYTLASWIHFHYAIDGAGRTRTLAGRGKWKYARTAESDGGNSHEEELSLSMFLVAHELNIKKSQEGGITLMRRSFQNF